MTQIKKKRRTVAAYPYHVYLGDKHVIEVKKGGLKVGIYLITPTSRRRGVVLPLEVWITLQQSFDIVNTAINLSRQIIQDGYSGEDTATTDVVTYQNGGTRGSGDLYPTNTTYNQYYTYGSNGNYPNFNYQQVSNGGCIMPADSTTVNIPEANIYQPCDGPQPTACVTQWSGAEWFTRNGATTNCDTTPTTTEETVDDIFDIFKDIISEACEAEPSQTTV